MEVNKEEIQFCKLIKSIDNHLKKKIKLSKDISNLFDEEVYLNVGDDLIDSILDFLEDKYNDTEGWINYFCWELDFGRESWRLRAVIDNKEVRIKTPNKLFKILKSRYKNA